MIVEENIVIRTVARRCDPLPTPAKIFFKKNSYWAKHELDRKEKN
jgi:hypothetical protein